MNPGKTFTEPLLLLAGLALVLLVVALRRLPRGGVRRLVAAAAAALALLLILAIPAVGFLIERSLWIDEGGNGREPEVIEVPGGGFLAAPDQGNLISYDSVMRARTAAEWWHRHPRATLVMAGRASDDYPAAMGEGMALVAREGGVPAEKIRLETESTNTREHPLRLLEAGYPRSTRVGLVTSRWHMRRALREFRLHFDVVIPHPVVPPPPRFASVGTWVPRLEGLERSTRMLHEWIGIAWYELGRLAGFSPGEEGR